VVRDAQRLADLVERDAGWRVDMDHRADILPRPVDARVGANVAHRAIAPWH
jgi:hypothetical protein